MKYSNNSVFKYIFIVVVLALIVGAIYIVYYKNKETNETDENKVSVTNDTMENISVVENLKMGVQSYDSMNPLLTHNKEIINIDKLIFEPLVNITNDYHVETCLAKEITKESDNVYKVIVDTSIKWQNRW